MRSRMSAWRSVLLGVSLYLVASVVPGEQFVLVCSLDTVDADGDSLGHDRFTLHVDTDRSTVDGDPAQIDRDHIRFFDPYLKDASTSIDRHSGQLKGVNGNRVLSTGTCKKMTR